MRFNMSLHLLRGLLVGDIRFDFIACEFYSYGGAVASEVDVAISMANKNDI